MKPVKILLLVVAAWIGLFASAGSVFSQTWTKAFNFHIPWTAVASSADGTKVVAVNTNGPMYYSTNSGATWAIMSGYPNTYYGNYLTAACSSADGTVLAVTAGHFRAGPIIISTNSGGAWVTNAPNEYWTCIASSANGSQLVAAATNGAVYISTNWGGTWAPSSAPINQYWISITSSADGSQLAVVATNNGPICVSTNGGNTWMTNSASSPNFFKPLFKPKTPGNSAPNTNWQAVACSADKTKLVAVVKGGLIYLSTDAGTTWTACNAPSTNWQSVACSADGAKMIAAVINGPVYTSTDAGTTWVTNNVPSSPWVSVASSADGSKLVAVATIVSGQAPIYTLQTTTKPRLNLLGAASKIALSWTLPSTNFVLQQSADLSSWSDVTNPPVLNLTNLQNQVTLSPSNSSGFYRLKTP